MISLRGKNPAVGAAEAPGEPSPAGKDPDNAYGIAPAVIRGVTPRAIVIGLLFSAFFSAVTPYNDFKIAATYLAGNQFPIGALFVLFVFAFGINGILRRVWPAKAFQSSELLTIWTLMLVASGIPSSGLMRYFIPNIAATTYLSTPTNGWERTVWGSTPSWLRISDPAAADAFIHGYHHGQEHVPWAAWTTPLFAWGILAVLFMTTTLCFTNLLRKQWVENEKFSFPLVTLPVMIAEEPLPGQALNSLFRNPMLWVGFSLVTVLQTINGLHQLYPNIPGITVKNDLGPLLTTPPWNHVGWLPFNIYPLVVGISYLLSGEVCFSLWFFFLFYKMELVIAGMYNYYTPGRITSYANHQFHLLQSFGGSLALFGWVAWSGRRHFKDVWDKAVGGPRAAEIDDSREMFSYRATVIGLAISFGGIALWLTVAGVPAILCASALLMLTLTLTMISWVVSQAGLLFAQQEYGTLDVMAPTIGTVHFHIAPQYTVTQFENVFLYDTREMLAPSILNGVKTADLAHYNVRSLFKGMIASISLSLIISAIASIMLPYYNGGGDAMFNSWMYRTGPSNPLSFLANASSVPYTYSSTNFLHILAGFVGVLGLLVMRGVLGYGLHPIGFLIASTYAMGLFWGSIMIGWACKLLIQRYGGMKGYRAALPLFMGFVLGDVVNAMVWVVLGYITKVGNQIMPG